MDLNHLRISVTLLGFVLFMALMLWTWWPSRKLAYQQEGILPCEDEPGRPLTTRHTAGDKP